MKRYTPLRKTPLGPKSFEEALANRKSAKGSPLKTEGARAKRNKSKLKETGYVKAEQCADCGSVHELHDHHILHRSTHPQMVAEPTNLITLCWLCHKLAHDYPITFEVWLEGKYPGRLEELRRLSRELSKSKVPA